MIPFVPSPYARRSTKATRDVAVAAAKWWRKQIDGSKPAGRDNGREREPDSPMNSAFGVALILSEQLTVPRNNVDAYDAFEKDLADWIENATEHRELSCDYNPSTMLAALAAKHGISDRAFPWKTRMSVYESYALASAGYGAEDVCVAGVAPWRGRFYDDDTRTYADAFSSDGKTWRITPLRVRARRGSTVKRIKPGAARELYRLASKPAPVGEWRQPIVHEPAPKITTQRTSMEAIDAVRAAHAPSSMPTPSPRVRALYRAPFTETCGYVYDADGHTVADFRRALTVGAEPLALRPRGWGRLQYLPDGEALHDEAEAFLINLVAEHPTDRAWCLAAINAAWIEQASPQKGQVWDLKKETIGAGRLPVTIEDLFTKHDGVVIVYFERWHDDKHLEQPLEQFLEERVLAPRGSYPNYKAWL